jgi:hypothetical protein
MVATPAEVLPHIECAVPSLIKALTKGAAYADRLQRRADARDPWFWSHSARWRAKQILDDAPKEGWGIVRSAPNSAIHLTFKGLQPARVLKSLNGTTPHAGGNRSRQEMWTFPEELALRTESGLQPIPLIFDWHIEEDGPVIHAGIPKSAGDYLRGAVLYWRVPITGDADEDLNDLEFNHPDPSPEAGVRLKVDPSEYETGL